jgi:gliding motility-associated-like protein
MTRVFLLVALSILISTATVGQCPTLTLSSTSGITCGLTPVTVADNTFGGSATKVTIRENGAGTVAPGTVNTSPFSFTYTPKSGDLGKTVTITLQTDNPPGPCSAAIATYLLSVSAGPSVTLSSSTGNTCGTTPITISNNTFGGGATSVTITHDGTGSISPQTTSDNPFSFTYNPAIGDIGNKVTIIVTTDNPMGAPCIAGTDSYVLSVDPVPSAPIPGTIAQPTCSVATGSVQLDGLPSSGSWTIKRTPGNVSTTGTGTSVTISGIPSGSYTFTVASSSGCISDPSSSVVINAQPQVPTAPVIGNIIQPGCLALAGSVTLTGLPSSGLWTLTRSPGGVITTGSGTIITISNLDAGTYTFKVTNSLGCISPSSGNVVISSATSIPPAPVVGAISPPTCSTPTGSVVLSGLPSTGNWTLTRYPGNVLTTGTGTSATVTGIPTGVFNYTITNSSGCVSGMSANVNVPSSPDVPTPPLIGTITQPKLDVPTGSVTLNGLPATGSWTLVRTPGNTATIGSGITASVSGLAPGIYSFTVTNAAGCTSASSASFEINAVTGPPVVKITNPLPVCYPSTVDLTTPTITAGSTPNLVFTYWSDPNATKSFPTPGAAGSGIYYIKGTASDGFSTIKPVTVTVYTIPVADAGPDQTLLYVFDTHMNAILSFTYESGLWSLITGSGKFEDSTNAQTAVTDLSLGKNKFVWRVTNHVCPVSTDTVVINVHDKSAPTLITPNNDGINDYLILKKADSPIVMDLVIFDRRGAEVYRNKNYDNSWNGVDYNGNQLPDDTYFYVLKSNDGTSSKGFVVIRRLK